MTTQDLQQMTVIELRKIAKDKGVTLGAGVTKSQIIEKISEALTEEARQAAPAPEQQARPASDGPQFHAAWHNPGPYSSSRSGYQARPRANYASNAGSAPSTPEMPHLSTVRPANYSPRFGPAAQDNGAPASAPAEVRTGNPMPPQPQDRGMQEDRRPGPSSRPSEPDVAPMTLSEMLAAGDLEDVCGVLELHPDGYGFLRNPATWLPSPQDIHVGGTVVKRSGLRTGDLITGKVRPKREADKYASLLYVSRINGADAETFSRFASFEEMHPAYPERLLEIGGTSRRMRLIGLLAPQGFGQRTTVAVPAALDRIQLLREMAESVRQGNPDAAVVTLMVDERPEEVELLRQAGNGEVVSLGFEQSAETRQKLVDLLVEHCERCAEQGQDVVLLVDTLNRIARSAALSPLLGQRIGLNGALTSVRAKKLFGIGRSFKEGGSVTVMALLQDDTDEQVMQEFRANATSGVQLDENGEVKLETAYTMHPELLLDTEQMAGLEMLQRQAREHNLEESLPQMLRMMDRAGGPYEVLRRLSATAQMDMGV